MVVPVTSPDSEYVKDARAFATPDVVGGAGSAGLQRAGGYDVRVGDVGDVYVVADAGAIGGGIVVTEYDRSLTAAQCRETSGMRLKAPGSPSSGVAAPATLK